MACFVCFRCILGTDMAKHTDILDAFTAKLVEHSISAGVQPPPLPSVADNQFMNDSSVQHHQQQRTTTSVAPSLLQLANIFDDDDEAKTLAMVVLLKMCDISTEIRPEVVAQPWLQRLIDELANQVRDAGFALSSAPVSCCLMFSFSIVSHRHHHHPPPPPPLAWIATQRFWGTLNYSFLVPVTGPILARELSKWNFA